MRIILIDNTDYTNRLVSIFKNSDAKLCLESINSDTDFIDTTLKSGIPDNVNALFINTVLNGNSSINLVSEIKHLLNSTPVIFLSGNILADAPDIYSIDPYFKPFAVLPYPTEEKHIKTILEQLNYIQSDKNKYFLVKNRNNKNTILKTRNIIYIESDKRKALINTISGTFEMYKKITDILDELPDYFIQPHNSFLVNVNYIDFFNSNNVFLKNNKTIPISKKYKKSFTEQISDLITNTKSSGLKI